VGNRYPLKHKLLPLLLFLSFFVNAQYAKLLDFTGFANGNSPYADLFYDGNFLYGMTTSGGVKDSGVIFKIKPDGTGYYKLYDFLGIPDGNIPNNSFISDGTFLYSMTVRGGLKDSGTIFKIKPDGTGYNKLFDFGGPSGGRPSGALFSDGSFLYGMTQKGGLNNYGTIFKIKTDGTGFLKLFDFSFATGSNPRTSALISDGVFLYGVTWKGGSSPCVQGCGTIFKIKPNGTGFVKLLDFNATNGNSPTASLSFDGTYLYGTTAGGGTLGYGTIFKIKPDGTGHVILHNCDNMWGGHYPYGSIISNGSFLYGMTRVGGSYGLGVIYKLKSDGSEFSVLHNFPEVQYDGCYPEGSLISDGIYLYGMTTSCGTNNKGIIFKYHDCGEMTDSIHMVPPICGSNNGSVTVVPSGGQGAYTYLWSNGNTTQSVTGLSGQPTDTLLVAVSDSLGCAITHTVYVNCITGMDGYPSATELTILPNPVQSDFTIQSSEKISAIEVVNVLGITVYSSSIHGSKSVIDLRGQPGGVYFVRVRSARGVAVKKLMKE
jgi:uncharacterized repeat protein (TIGR03803 family)